MYWSFWLIFHFITCSLNCRWNVHIYRYRLSPTSRKGGAKERLKSRFLRLFLDVPLSRSGHWWRWFCVPLMCLSLYFKLSNGSNVRTGIPGGGGYEPKLLTFLGVGDSRYLSWVICVYNLPNKWCNEKSNIFNWSFNFLMGVVAKFQNVEIFWKLWTCLLPRSFSHSTKTDINSFMILSEGQ